jgi:hypothetical protein
VSEEILGKLQEAWPLVLVIRQALVTLTKAVPVDLFGVRNCLLGLWQVNKKSGNKWRTKLKSD